MQVRCRVPGKRRTLRQQGNPLFPTKNCSLHWLRKPRFPECMDALLVGKLSIVIAGGMQRVRWRRRCIGDFCWEVWVFLWNPFERRPTGSIEILKGKCARVQCHALLPQSIFIKNTTACFNILARKFVRYPGYLSISNACTAPCFLHLAPAFGWRSWIGNSGVFYKIHFSGRR